MQQYCRPSAVITGTWLWKELHTRNTNASLSLAGILCRLQQGNLLAGEGSPDQGWENVPPRPRRTLPTSSDNQQRACGRDGKGPHGPPLLSTNPPGFPAA